MNRKTMKDKNIETERTQFNPFVTLITKQTVLISISIDIASFKCLGVVIKVILFVQYCGTMHG